MVKLADIVSFRRDLLFNGAVQIDWLESNPSLAEKAALHFAFHGPSYHGVVREPEQEQVLPPVDTATFTLDIIERLTGKKADEPFTMAIAGYGTGKSHLAVTLASLLGAPDSPLASHILGNLCSADARIGAKAREMLAAAGQPFLVLALNGMKDFDLTGEIVRQVLRSLRARNIDASPLEDLRPRFKYAVNFTESFFEALRKDYGEAFGPASLEEIVARLGEQDEEAFRKVSAICEQKTGTAIRAMGQESLQDFVRVARETYCGEGRPFAGILVLFDEFGRYLEFAVQRPQVAGPGALQQLHEAVQTSADGVFLLCFIQSELKAYISRIAPELQADLQRYVTRYDAVPKARLSTNLETLIAHLLEKRDPAALARQVAPEQEHAAELQKGMERWFPELGKHAVWANSDTFKRIVQEGCWPLHPMSTWLLYRLASVGRSLQQRSALSLLADTYAAMASEDVVTGFVISPVDLCTDALIDEFTASERFGQQGASAQAYRSVLGKYAYQLSREEIRALKAVLLMAKVGARTAAKHDCVHAISLFCGGAADTIAGAIQSLESERGALSWNEAIHQYEVVSDAVPRAQFLAYLGSKVKDIPASLRAQIFSENLARWFPDLAVFNTDFGASCDITTKEWAYRVSFANVQLLPNQIDHAFRNWLDATAVDEPKGQLLYCYVGAESDLATVRESARMRLQSCLQKAHLSRELGAPIAILFLYDENGGLGEKVAEYWTLQQGMDARDLQRYANFVLDRKSAAEDELRSLFDALQRHREMVFATDQEIAISNLSAMLTRLFECVYPEHIPFPFDGFSTAAGNAASDCAAFTRQLFLGLLDRDWMTAQAPRQRNRAVEVLVESWGVLDNAGALRILPANPSLRRTIEWLDSRLTTRGDPQPLNLGRALRALCAPPHGCSLASGGLVLALFVGPRREALDLLRGGQPVSPEQWLQAALPRTCFDLSVLDGTIVVQVSEQAVGEWNRLLNAWEIETTHSGKLEYRRKADGLAQRLPVPQALYYQYENLCLQTQEAERQLRKYDSRLDDALAKLDGGTEEGDVGRLSWGAALLCELRADLAAQPGLWTEEQAQVVERREAEARVETQRRFAGWLSRQTVENVAQLPQFLHRMQLVGRNLDTLGLEDEKAALEQQATHVEEHIRFLERVHRLRSEVTSFTRSNTPNASTSLRTIQAWLDRATELGKTLAEAQERKVGVPKGGLEATAEMLVRFREACSEHVRQLKERGLRVYNAEIKSLQDVQDLQAEVGVLRQLFDGQERDLSDLDLIRRQLGSLEANYRKLDSDELSDAEFDVLLQQCKADTEAEFGDDGPPLDNEASYDGLAQSIRARRQRDADEWMRAHVPQIQAVLEASAQRALEIRARLQAAPRFLTAKQAEATGKALEACVKRLDELEVDGLVARYELLSQPNKRLFLAKIGVRAQA